MSERLAQTPRLRDSTPADLEAIERLYAHHVRHGTGSFELEPPTLAEVTRRRDDVLANGFAHRVAEAGGEVVGFAYFNFFRMRPAYRFSVENSVYVRAGLSRGGIGRALLLDLIDQARARGVRQMIAVTATAPTPARSGCMLPAGFDLPGSCAQAAGNLTAGSIPSSCSARSVRAIASARPTHIRYDVSLSCPRIT